MSVASRFPTAGSRRTRRSLALRVGSWMLAVVVIATPSFAQAVNWPLERPPRPLPAREVKFPPYEVRTLANGMQVLAVLHHEQPAVSMRLLVRAGAAHDPQGKGGVANLVASLLDQGTTTRSAEQVADQIDSIGGAMGTGSGPDMTLVTAVVMKDSFAVAMDLVADVVRNPAFAPDEIDRQMQQALSSLQVSQNDPDYVASVLFDRLVYGFHPYGLPGSGTPQTLAAITREDLQAFHRRYFVPNNMILAIVGDVTSEEAFAAAERVFGAWPRADVPPFAPAEPPPATRRVVVVDMPSAVQTEIRVGQLAIPRKHADYLAFDLAVKILGGEGANRLHRVLRSERGLTYGASAETQAMKQAGDFVAETDTQTETTGEVLRLTVDEFGKIQRQRVFERELADAQAYLAGNFPLTIETPNQIATQILNAVFYELPMDEISTFRERVLAVTPDDIQRVAQRYIRPDRLSIVLVGNASAFVPQLRAVGFTDFEVIPIAELDLMSATLKRESPRASGRSFGPLGSFGSFGSLRARVAYTDLQANASAGGDPTARDILKRAIEAKGGLERLRNLRTLVADAEMVLQTPRGEASVPTKTYIAYPDQFRLDTIVPGQESTLVYDRGRVWVKDPRGVADAPEAGRLDAAASISRDVVLMLLAAADGTVPVKLVTDGQAVEGSRVLEFSTSDSGAVLLHFNDDMHVTRQVYETRGSKGERLQGEEVFSDYRTVDGISLAFQADIVRDGRPILRRTLRNVVINGPVPSSVFARPQ